jgi:PAS domain S-box-containing protein
MGKPTVLVVDDEPDSLKLLTDILCQEGYDVRAADSGKLALLSLAARRPDLILLDLRMPGMDGLEVFRRFKHVESSVRVPVIFISGSLDFERRLEALALGAVDFVTKPFRREELVLRVRNHIELARLRSRLDAEVSRRTTVSWEVLAHLHESEDRFRLLADTAPVLIWMAGPDLSHTFFNKGWLDFTGRAMEQELGNGWIESVHPDDRERYLDASLTALGGRREFQVEFKLRRGDGQYRWMLCRAVPRFLPDGGFEGYIGCAIDITDSRRTREESYDRQRTESLRVLSSGLAHDFRNITAGILLQVEDAEMELASGNPPGEQLASIKNAASRASEIVNQLMIYAGNENATLEPCNISSLVEQMVELLKVSIPKQVHLETQLDHDVSPVWGTPRGSAR